MKNVYSLITFLVFFSSSVLSESFAPTVVTVTFPDNNSKFNPSLEVEKLLESASSASIIIIRGRTSTNNPSAQDEALAFKRAAAARAFLVKRGVSPMKIMINYISAADYVTDNSSEWGKLMNQRVEIEMFYPKM